MRVGRMRAGARTPEELETLFEDAFVLRDRGALVELFDDGAVLVADAGRPEARGADQIAGSAGALWRADRNYVAEAQRVVQARDTALVVGRRAVNVVRRGNDGMWRYAISLLSLEDANREEKQ